MSIKPVLVPDHTANDLRRLMDSFAEAATGPTRQQLAESRSAVAAAARGVTEGSISDLLNQDPTSPKFNDHPGASRLKKSEGYTPSAGELARDLLKTPDDVFKTKYGMSKHQANQHYSSSNLKEQGIAEAGRPDVMRHTGDKTVKVVKRRGVPIGEIGLDTGYGEESYYVKLYDGSYDAAGFDTAAEALQELKAAIKQMSEGVTEGAEKEYHVINHRGTPTVVSPSGKMNKNFSSTYDAQQFAKKKNAEIDKKKNVSEGVTEGVDKEARAILRNLIVADVLNFYSMHDRIPSIKEFSRPVRAKLNALEFDERSTVFRQAVVQALKLLSKQGMSAALTLDEHGDPWEDPNYDPRGGGETRSPEQIAKDNAEHAILSKKLGLKNTNKLPDIKDDMLKMMNHFMRQPSDKKDVDESAADIKYGVFAKGGSVGSQRFRDDPLKTFDTREEATADAKRRRSGLSKGERGYYGMGYVVKPVKGEVAEDRTEVKDAEGRVKSWRDESEWKKSEKKDPRGKVTNLSDKARRETEKTAAADVAESIDIDPIEQLRADIKRFSL